MFRAESFSREKTLFDAESRWLDTGPGLLLPCVTSLVRGESRRRARELKVRLVATRQGLEHGKGEGNEGPGMHRWWVGLG